MEQANKQMSDEFLALSKAIQIANSTLYNQQKQKRISGYKTTQDFEEKLLNEKTALNNARQIQRDSDRNFSKFYESLNKSRNDYNNSINNSSNNNNNRITNCSYESEFVSGYNKICSYNCRGSLSTLTIGQYQQCPSYLR